MNTIKSINIQSPCHESWDGMTPNANGRHCQSCSKTVTDFSQMTDAQIISYLSNNHNICGRIGVKQLEKLNEHVVIERLSARSMWQRLLVAASFIFATSTVKAAPSSSHLTIQTEQRNLPADTTQRELMGKIKVPELEYRIITGVIIDEENKPIAGATIKNLSGKIGTMTNAQGEFSLRVPANEREIIVAFIGYQQKILKIKKLKGNRVKLKLDPSVMGDIAIVQISFMEKTYHNMIVQPLKKIFG